MAYKRTSLKREVLFRRAPHLVSYWQDDQLFLINYATGARVTATPLATDVLDFFESWRSATDLTAERPWLEPHLLRKLVGLLGKCSLLHRSDSKPSPTEQAMESWDEWNPAAGFFHFSTKDAPYGSDESAIYEFYEERLRTTPLPPPNKRYSRLPSTPLPVANADSELSKVLLARRTWRRFSRKPLDLAAMGNLLGLTFGVQAWVDFEEFGLSPLKTSPSGGARHPIEAYVLARRVRGLIPGLYHYDGDTHSLKRLKRGASAGTIEAYLPGQPWYKTASALILMTAVFPRTMWKYPYPRVYRAVLLEAGHFCQTFCLVATSLGLAPFCTAALADTRIEKDLGVDGVRESVLYVAGVGTRPSGVKWAPWPGTTDAPRTRPPRYKRSRSRKR